MSAQAIGSIHYLYGLLFCTFVFMLMRPKSRVTACLKYNAVCKRFHVTMYIICTNYHFGCLCLLKRGQNRSVLIWLQTPLTEWYSTTDLQTLTKHFRCSCLFAYEHYTNKHDTLLMTLTPHLYVIANAVCTTHLEKDTVVDDGEVRVEQFRTHHCVALGVRWLHR